MLQFVPLSEIKDQDQTQDLQFVPIDTQPTEPTLTPDEQMMSAVGAPGEPTKAAEPRQPSDVTEMRAWEPTIWERIQNLIPGDRAKAANEYAARQIAKEQGVSVDEAYRQMKEAVGARGIMGGRPSGQPMFNPEGRAPIKATAEAAPYVFEGLLDIPKGMAESALRAYRAGDIENAVDSGDVDKMITYLGDESKEIFIPNIPKRLGMDTKDPNYQGFMGLGKSLGYSLTTMVASATAGTAATATTGSPIAGVAAGMGTSGAVAYRASKDDFLDRLRDKLNKDSQKVFNRPMSDAEWKDAKEKFNSAAVEYGAWEAIPEAISNAIFLKAFSAPVKGAKGAKLAGYLEKATSIAAENITETATGLGQNAAELKAGLTQDELTIADAFKQQFIQTMLTMGVTAGGMKGVEYANKFYNEQVLPKIDPASALAKAIKADVEQAGYTNAAFRMKSALEEQGAPQPPNLPVAPVVKPTEGEPPEEPTAAAQEPELTFEPLVAGAPETRIEPRLVRPEDLAAEALPGMPTGAELEEEGNAVTVAEPTQAQVAVTEAAVKPTQAAAALPEVATVPPVTAPKAFEPAAPQHELQGMATQEVPLSELKLSKDVPQFKIGASDKGVVEPLGGKFERTGVAPIQVWRRLDGTLEVISGRHRFDLAQRSGEKTIPAQIHDESQGFGKLQAAILDAELNIRDGQGKVKDYVNYFKESGIDRETADSRGLLARATGKRSFTIANEGSDELVAAVRGDQIGDEAAYYIALNAPQDARLQGVGIKAVMDGKSMNTAVNTMQAVKALAGENDTTTDMFGFDDSAIKEAEEMAKIAASKQREIQTRLSAISGAAKNPAVAKAEGIDVKDPEAVQRRIGELRQLKAAWDNWSTNPQLVAEIRSARGVAAPELTPIEQPVAEQPAEPTEDLLTMQTPEELQARADAEAQAARQQTLAEQEAERRAQADREVGEFMLTGSDRAADVAAAQGQQDIFGVAAEEPAAPNFFKDVLPGMGYKRLDRGSPRAYRDKAGKEFPTYEKDGVRVAFTSNELLFEDDRGNVTVGMAEPTDLVFQYLGVDPQQRGQNKASGALKDVAKAADTAGVVLYLEPASLDETGLTTPQLVSLYKRFGFEQVKPGSDKVLSRQPGAEATSDFEAAKAKLTELAEKLLTRNNVRSFTDELMFDGREVWATRRIFEGKLYPSEMEIVRAALGNATRISLINTETRNLDLDLIGKNVGEGSMVRVADTQYLAEEKPLSSEYEQAIEKSNEAVRKFNKIQEAYRKQEIGDEEFLAGRREFDAAMAEFDEAIKKEQEQPEEVDDTQDRIISMTKDEYRGDKATLGRSNHAALGIDMDGHDAKSLVAQYGEKNVRFLGRLYGINVKDIKSVAKKLIDIRDNLALVEGRPTDEFRAMTKAKLDPILKQLGMSSHGQKWQLVEKITRYAPDMIKAFNQRLQDLKHQAAVTKAVQQGIEVKDEVLKDYPELVLYARDRDSDMYKSAARQVALKLTKDLVGMEWPQEVQRMRDSLDAIEDPLERQVTSDVADAIETYYESIFNKRAEVAEKLATAKAPTMSEMMAESKRAEAQLAALEAQTPAAELTTKEREEEIARINAQIKKLALEQIKLPLEDEKREAEIDEEMKVLVGRLNELKGKKSVAKMAEEADKAPLEPYVIEELKKSLVELQRDKATVISGAEKERIQNEIDDIEAELRDAGIDPRTFAIEANEEQGEAVVNDEQPADTVPSNQRLLLLPCSDMKAAEKAPAMDLYKGVFFQTYKANVQPGAFPLVVILSAKHGFVNADEEIAPYDEVMSTARADTMLTDLSKYVTKANWPSGITDVMIVGGKEYQRVMRAAVAELQSYGIIDPDATINATSGGIGVQRQQLGEYLRSIQPETPVLTNEPFTIDVEARVIDENVALLPRPDVHTLEKHYGVKRGTAEFAQMVKDDIVRFANEGAEAVAKAIREIIRKLHAGVLSMAIIFNPTNITPPEFVFHPSYTYTVAEQVLAEVPDAAVSRMSPSARQVYKVLYPSVKDRLIKDNKFMVIADKPSARIFVFRPDGSLLLDKKSLFGLAQGDFYKGNNDLPQNRITPAGHFTMGLRDAMRSPAEARTAGEYDFKKVFVLDKAIAGEYSVTMFHSVWLHESDAAARARALQSEEATDSRYSFGCINVDKPTYSILVNNHLEQMDGASLFVVPDDPANLASLLSGATKAGDELVRTGFKPATVEVTKTVPLQSAKGQRGAADVVAAEPRKKASDFMMNVEAVPAYMDVDGVRRPTTNSSGQQIHPTKDGIKNFWRWFGDSKIVDKDGKPLVVYHATSKSFESFQKQRKYTNGFYFTPDLRYGYVARAGDIEGGNVMPVYLRSENPFFTDHQPMIEVLNSAPDAPEYLAKLKADGYDAVLFANKNDIQKSATGWGADYPQFFIFDNTQIKSAIGNIGTYGKTESMIANTELREEQIKEYTRLRSQLARIPRKVAEGKAGLDTQETAARLLQQTRDLNQMLRATAPRRDSAEKFLAKALEEFDKGNIDEEVLNVIKLAYDKHPDLLEGLLLSVKALPEGRKGTAGQFLPMQRIVRLYKGTSGIYDPVTIRHELTHSLEQMMTPEQRMAVVQAWGKALQRAIKQNPDELHQKYFHAVMDFIDNPSEKTFRAAQAALPSYEMYQFLNPSEFWAVNAEKLMAAELGSAWDKFKRAIRRMWEGLKNVFGFDNRYVVQKTFKDVMNGRRERVTKEMLVDLVASTGGRFTTLENIEDEKNLMSKYNRPHTPQLDTTPLKTFITRQFKNGKEFFQDAAENPREAMVGAGDSVMDGMIYLRNKNVWYGSGLEARDFDRYNGELKTAQGFATASVALDNAIRSGNIGVEVIFKGGLKFDKDSNNFVAVERKLGMKGVYEAEAELKKKLGNQLGTDIIQGYLEAKRSISIMNELYEREAAYEVAKEQLKYMKENNGTEEEILEAQAVKDAAAADLDAIKKAASSVNMSEEEMYEFAALDKKHKELRDIMDNWTAVNQNMLKIWRQVGLISEGRYNTLSSIQDYVPWFRIMNDEEDVHSPLQSTTRSLTNIGREKLFKRGKPLSVVDFRAKQGQKDFKIQPSSVVKVEVNGKPVAEDLISVTPTGEVRIDMDLNDNDLVVFKTNREIENIIDNMTRNVMRMTMNGIRQAAANRIVLEYGSRNEKGKIMVFPSVDKEKGRFNWVVNGKKVVVEIQDPLVAESIYGMENLNLQMWAPLAAVANITRRTITLSGVFQIKQVFKDAPTAALVTGVKNPLALIGGVWKGFLTSLTMTDPVVDILKAAGIGGFHSPARTPEAEIKRRLGIMNRNVFSTVIKGLDHIGDASDMAQRVATYKRVLAETGDETQALYQAANVINFLHHGSAGYAQAAVKVVPFLGAYANSMDVLIRSLMGGGLKGMSRQKALARLGITMSVLVSLVLLYCMLAGADPEYDELDDQTKLKNIIIPGTKIMLPMNTSAAYFFKAIPELIYNKVTRDGTENEYDRRRLRKALGDAARDMLLGPEPIPAGVKPIIEVAINHDFFTGRPVIPEGLKDVEAAEQYTASTSELGKKLSAMLEIPGTDGKRVLNPIEADHIVRGVFGTAGAMSQWVSNSIGAMAEERPEPTAKEAPITGSFLREEVPRGREDLFYDFKSAVNEKYQTWKKMMDRGDYDAADAYIDKHGDVAAMNDYIVETEDELKEINAEIRRLGETREKDETPKERREAIDEYKRLKSEILEPVKELRREVLK